MKIKISRWALQDIQDATDWYNQQVPGLGKKFQNQVKNQIAYCLFSAAFDWPLGPRL